MAGRRKLERKKEDVRPVVVDDFIYEDPEEPASARISDSASDTPEEAIRKLQRKKASAPDTTEEAARRLRRRKGSSADDGFGDDPGPEDAEDPAYSGEADGEKDGESAEASPGRKVYAGGLMLDDNLQPIEADGRPRHARKRHPLLRGIVLTGVTLVLLICIAAFLLHRISPNLPGLDVPENAIGSIVTPVQNLFSGLTETVAGYFRSLKLQANLEAEYNALRAENEQLVYKAMLADELQNTLAQYEDLSDEITANAAMRPIVCTVIGKSDSNYFSTLTINKGTADGVEDYMAVTISGALVGYTESTQAHKATVRTIIDSDASIAALIQSSRDQGTVRGTLGVDGTPLCRMYYLPDDNLPRPGDLVVTSGVGMSFPKGIPIGSVRESTRGMDANKQYIVLEPQVDFQHLEYVIVLRYKPQALAVEGRENGKTDVELVPLESARPSPVVPQIASSLFESQNTPTPDPNAAETAAPGTEGEPSEDWQPDEEPDETVTPPPTDTPSPTPTLPPTVVPDETPFEYQVVNLHGDPTPTPTPTYAPTSTPYFTPDPADMDFEED